MRAGQAGLTAAIAAIAACVSQGAQGSSAWAAVNAGGSSERNESGCPRNVELTDEDLGCRCGIEMLGDRHLRGLPEAREIRNGVIWLCNNENKLGITLDPALEKGGRQ